MQALCAFAHAAEVNMRENQRIRRRIVHGGDKGNKPPAFCILSRPEKGLHIQQ